jgi:outer membrane protein TolC
MKSCRRCIIAQGLAALLLALGTAGPLAGQVVERTFTLDQATAAGLHNNQEYLALQEQIFTAQQRINEARALIYPKIDLNASASRFNNEQPTVLSPSFNSLYLPVGNRDLYYTTRFSLWQYLYAGGRYTTNLQLAEINLSQSQSQADMVRNRIVLDVVAAFYECVYSREKIAVREKALAALAKNGAGRTRWAAFERKLRNQIVEARHEYEKSRLRFLKAVGSELNAVVDFTAEELPAFEDYDLDKCLARAYQYRPELRKTQFEETIDSLRVNLSQTERYPTVTLGANYEWIGETYPPGNENWNATINLNLPIFDGWASWARIKQRRSQAREGKIRRARIEDQIRFEVREAYMDYVFWKGRLMEPDRLPADDDPEMKLEADLAALEMQQKAVVSMATLEWAVGSPLGK